MERRETHFGGVHVSNTSRIYVALGGKLKYNALCGGLKITALASYQNQFQQGDTRILAFWIIYGTVSDFMLFVLLFAFVIIVVTLIYHYFLFII